MAPKRRVSFNARLKDPGWDWRAALAKFPLKLVESNPGGWKPDMDWFLRPDSVGRILEGKYDWAKATGTAGSAAGAAGRQSEIERRKELQRASLKGGSSNDGG